MPEKSTQRSNQFLHRLVDPSAEYSKAIMMEHESEMVRRFLLTCKDLPWESDDMPTAIAMVWRLRSHASTGAIERYPALIGDDETKRLAIKFGWIHIEQVPGTELDTRYVLTDKARSLLTDLGAFEKKDNFQGKSEALTEVVKYNLGSLFERISQLDKDHEVLAAFIETMQQVPEVSTHLSGLSLEQQQKFMRAFQILEEEERHSHTRSIVSHETRPNRTLQIPTLQILVDLGLAEFVTIRIEEGDSVADDHNIVVLVPTEEGERIVDAYRASAGKPPVAKEVADARKDETARDRIKFLQ